MDYSNTSITSSLKNILKIRNELHTDELWLELFNDDDLKKTLDKYKGVMFYASKDDYPEYDIMSNEALEGFEISTNIKYLLIRCDAEYYKNIKIPSHIEYVCLYTSVHEIYHNNILEDIKLPADLKSLQILIDLNNAVIISNERKDTRFPQLSTVDIETDTNAIDISIQKLNDFIPHTLEYLEVNFPILNIEKFVNLKTYIISSEFDYDDFNKPLDNLPSNLEYLAIYPKKFNQPLNNLPNGLKYLNVGRNRLWYYYNGYSQHLNNLPASLEILYHPETLSMDDNEYHVDLSNLPPNLKILNIPEFISSNINFNCLPDSIEILEWEKFINHYEKIEKYPLNLKEIRVREYYDEIKDKFKDYPFDIKLISI